jgi:hypothetical protein
MIIKTTINLWVDIDYDSTASDLSSAPNILRGEIRRQAKLTNGLGSMMAPRHRRSDTKAREKERVQELHRCY